MTLYPAISSLPSPLLAVDLVPRLKELAIQEYPREFAALILKDGELVPMTNLVNAGPASREFKMDPLVWMAHERNVLAVVHSHPDGPSHPSAEDMEFGLNHGVILGLMVSGPDWASDPFWWGEGVPIPPMLGRNFRHGPSGSDGKGDCYALIKDFYQVHRDVKLKEFPRDWEWWTKDKDLYVKGFPETGFRVIPASEAIPGDVFLAAVRSEVPNHGGILWDNGSILHHMTDRLSARTAHGTWDRFITHWLRYEDDLPPWSAAG